MFTTPCFIRKNTQELREKLEELGYGCIYDGSVNDNIISCFEGMYAVDYKSHPACFDCSDNEPLFLALAALRDDSDYMQWLLDDANTFNLILHKGQSLEETMNADWYEWECFCKGVVGKLRKATPAELLSHFGNDKK